MVKVEKVVEVVVIVVEALVEVNLMAAEEEKEEAVEAGIKPVTLVLVIVATMVVDVALVLTVAVVAWRKDWIQLHAS